MNRQGLMITVAAMATLAGCLDPEWQSKRPSAKTAATTMPPAALEDTPSAPVTDEVPGGRDVTVASFDDIVIVDNGPVAGDSSVLPPAPPPPPPPAPETTVYYVQYGDTLSKISKKFNIKIDAIKRTNGLTSDNIRVGQKLTLPGSFEVGEQKTSSYVTYPSVKDGAKNVKPYTGETKTYKIQPGDTLGGIAKKNGTTVAQLVQINNLESDKIRSGKTIKVPVSGAKASTAPVQEKKSETVKTAAPASPATPPKSEDAKSPSNDIDDINSLAIPPPAPDPVSDSTFVYKVKGGEDITGISIQFDITPTEIRQLNGLADDAELTEGMEIKLPLSARE